MLALLGISVSVPAAVLFWDTPFFRTSVVGGTIDSAKSISFTNDYESAKTSPICGCAANLPKEQWAGISFIRKSALVRYDDKGDDAYTVIFSAPFPEPTSPYSPLQLRIFIETKEGRTFNLPRTFFPLNAFEIVSRGNIKIKPINESPQFTLIPSAYSRNTISFFEDGNGIKISSSALMKGLDNRAEFVPYLDVLGKQIEISFDQDLLSIVFVSPKSKGPLEHDGKEFEIDSRDIEKIYVNVPFSMRLAFLEATFNSAERTTNTAEGSFDSDPPTIDSRVGTGDVILQGVEPLDDAEYSEAQSKLDRSSVIATDVETNFQQLNFEFMDFRQPFIAPQAGFHIYGEMRELKLDGARADLMLGATHFPVAGSSNILFENIQPVFRDPKFLAAPLEFDRNEGGKLDFQASSTITVNGEEIYAAGLTFGILSSILSVILTFVLGYMQFRESARNKGSRY